MIEIPLTQGRVALVDDRDAHLAAFKWCAMRAFNAWYAVRGGRREDGTRGLLLLHREVLGAPKGVGVDHRSGDGLDCRRENLRLASDTQNQRNQRRRKDNTSGFKGVGWRKAERKWQARITVHGKKRHLGLFASAEAAARAYDAAAREAFGDFARINSLEGA